MKLYRTVSSAERDDYTRTRKLRTAKNTLEGKQFFKSEIAVRRFIAKSRLQSYSPPYEYLFVIELDDDCLQSISFDEQELDFFDAITVFKADLPRFNNCIKFVHEDAF